MRGACFATVRVIGRKLWCTNVSVCGVVSCVCNVI